MVVLTRLGPPESGIRHSQDKTKVMINEKTLGTGKLFISEARVSWVSQAEASGASASSGPVPMGFSLEYPHIACHAVQRNREQFPHPNLYLIIDVRLMDSDGTPSPTSTDEERGKGGDEEDDEEEEGDKDSGGGITEVRFIPEDSTSLEAMFQAMSECQKLHPDPADISEDEDEDDEDGEGEGGEGEEEEGMYDDAEEDEEVGEQNGGHHDGGGGGGEQPMEES